MKKYAELQKLYKFDTSPLFGINGRYLTSLQFASKREGVKQEEEAVATEMFKVLDELVAKSQKENAEAANKKATEAKTAKEEASAKIPEKAVADTGNKSADNAVNTAGASSSGIGGTEVFFDFGKSDLKAEGKESLDGLIEDLKKSDVKKIVLTGHTDSIGSDSFNMNLGKRRAQTVRNYLVGKGVNAKKVLVQSQGKRQPAYTNETEEGRAKNCRVVVQAS